MQQVVVMQVHIYQTTNHHRRQLSDHKRCALLDVVGVGVGVGLVGQIRASVVAAGSPSLLVVAVVVVLVVVDGGVGASGEEGLLVAVLAVALLGVALAAAGAEEPEHGGGNGKGSAQPGGGQHVCVDGTSDTVGLGGTLNGTDNNDGQSSNHTGGSADGGGGDTTDQVGDAGDGAAAVGEETENQLKTQGDHGNDVDNLGPLGNGLESSQGVGDLIGKSDVVTRSRQVAVVEGGLGPVELGLGAVPVAISINRAVSLVGKVSGHVQ